ncbi:MAG: hypothetical protein U0575_03755 [Phycisphaerales bacterium]
MPTSASRIGARIFLAIFVAAMIGTAIFSRFVVRDVRQDAAATDVDVRVVGWAVLVSVDRRLAFPTSAAQLHEGFAAAIAPDTQSPARWPATIEEAGLDPTIGSAEGAVAWNARIDAALKRLVVEFSGDPRQPPNVTPGGHPTGVGTLADVNGWLRGRADALATAAPASSR